MQPQQLFSQYQELQRYVAWSEQDVARVQAVFPLVQPHLPSLIDDFYEEINRHPNARKVITGGEQQIARLTGMLMDWLGELFSGTYDEHYVTRRWKVGWRHVEIGLSQVFTNAALSRLRDGLSRLIAEHWVGDVDERARTIRSLNKLLDLDLAIIEDAYQAEYLKRQQQIERLAAIGQISGGVAHELRNPLNVVKTSVYYLLHAKHPTAEKTTEHLHRIARQVEVADAVTTALTDFARLPLPRMSPFALEPCLQEILETSMLPDNVHVKLDCADDLPAVLGDQQQLMIVFGNLIRNARDAMPDGGTLAVTAHHAGGEVDITIADSGVGIAPEDLKRIHEPLYSTKARGMGLGLAITRAILEKHAAQLKVSSRPGAGSTFTVRVAAAIAAGES